MQALYAPGARVVVRDCEWIVRRADPCDDGGYILTVDGLSELVMGKSAQFLTSLEEQADAIRVLDPAETRFEQDMSPGFEKSRLFIETQLRQITPADDPVHLGHHATIYSINVYGPIQPVPDFKHIANLFIPQTVDVCFVHEGRGQVPGIKEEVESAIGAVKTVWNTNGHRDRIIEIGQHELYLFAQLYDETGTDALEARLPALHARQLTDVLEKFAAQSRRLGDLKGQYFSTVMFDKTYAQRDGIIKRDTQFPETPDR